MILRLERATVTGAGRQRAADVPAARWATSGALDGAIGERALKQVAEWCREHLHDEVRTPQEALGMKLRGHLGYYGITGNSRAIMLFLFKATEMWRKWLNRRSQRASMTWPRMRQLLERYPLPRPHITHPLLPRAASP